MTNDELDHVIKSQNASILRTVETMAAEIRTLRKHAVADAEEIEALRLEREELRKELRHQCDLNTPIYREGMVSIDTRVMEAGDMFAKQWHESRRLSDQVKELHAANNRLLEERRNAEAKLAACKAAHSSAIKQAEGD